MTMSAESEKVTESFADQLASFDDKLTATSDDVDMLTDIQDGTFARNWIAENEAGMPEFKRMMSEDLEHPIEQVGANLRGHMDWLQD